MKPPHSLLAVLHRQHARIAALADRVMREGGSDRNKALDALLRYLAVHESAEQILLHPAGLRSGGDSGAVKGRVVEEHEIEALAMSLEGLDPESVDFMIYFGLLEEALTIHTRAEEEVEVPMLGQTVPAPELDQIARDLSLVDTWLAPGAPSTDGHESRVPWPNGVQLGVGFDELHRMSQQAFADLARGR